MRPDGRKNDELRPVHIERGYIRTAHGSALVECGNTRVLCTAMVDDRVPQWLHRSGRGWVSAEYSMLPGSTQSRKSRDRGGQVDGRMVEIQRLIGRALRGVINTELIGERTIWLDCDVLQADGGTRTASITGAYVALCDAVEWLRRNKGLTLEPMTGQVAALSVGICKGEIRTDICYLEDSEAEVDMNVVMLTSGEFIEVQSSGERGAFSGQHLQDMVSAAAKGIREIFQAQNRALGRDQA